MVEYGTEIRVFNVEFEGIDKCGKDTLRNEMLSVFPNICSYKARGVLSQYAYQSLYHRPWNYRVTEGYFHNTLIVFLDVSNEDDWLARLAATNEIESNDHRTDVDFVADYNKHRNAFIDAFNYLKSLDIAKDYQDHFLYCDTSLYSIKEIAHTVRQRLIDLNYIQHEYNCVEWRKAILIKPEEDV